VVESTEIAAQMSEALNPAGQCSSAETLENYSHLAAQLQQLNDLAAQTLRSHTAYQPVLTKLQQGASLTADELQTLRSLIVGDADEYLKYDDDFEAAKTELTKLLDEIRVLASSDNDPEALKHLRVLCREASSALGPVLHYLEQKERVQNFEEHTRGPLSVDAARILAGIVRNMAA
jgi:CHASE3 domain sensor protein